MRLFSSYFALTFLTMMIFVYRNPVCKTILKSKPSVIQYDPMVCKSIESVESSTENITVYFKNNMLQSPSFILQHFALSTSWQGQPIFFPLGSANLTNSNASSISFSFYLPVVSAYRAELFCSAPKHSIEATLYDTNRNSLRSYPLILIADDFSMNPEFTRLRCHHNEWHLRWCEAKNLPYFSGLFFFFTPAIFTFPSPFLVPGPRVPPFDKDGDRFTLEPVCIQISAKTSSVNFTIKKQRSYIYGVFHNYHMLWHAIFDFIVPFYQFQKSLNSTESLSERMIYVKSDGVWMFHTMMKAISENPITIIKNIREPMLFEDAVIGIEKTEKDSRVDRTMDDMVKFEYSFNRSSAIGVRELVLKAASVNDSSEWPPSVILIDRRNSPRNVGNNKEIAEYLEKTCPFCKVRMVSFENMAVNDQIEITSKASVLLGLHGSGLAHVMWMSPSTKNRSTHIIEFLPYLYGCRDWYHMAANVAGVDYHYVMNNRPSSNVTDGVLAECYENPDSCATVKCHDVLRDQPVSIELTALEKVWLPIVKRLKEEDGK